MLNVTQSPETRILNYENAVTYIYGPSDVTSSYFGASHDYKTQIIESFYSKHATLPKPNI